MRVLEIGCGGVVSKLAKYSGGLLFQSPSVEYVGVDPVIEVYGPAASQRTDGIELIAADCTDLPLESESFDVVMMRSFFGQFLDSHMRRGLHGATHMGLMEAYRVLRPGGEIVVAEENTPWDARRVEHLLGRRGFRVSAFKRMSEPYRWTEVNPDNPWLRLRSQYYADRPTQRARWLSHGDSPPYIMTGIKPEGAGVVREKVCLGVDPETAEVVLTDREYVHGQPIVSAALTQDK
jgi:ubiquinone/menaquinone biosynthesis C-methylase UbiE